MPRAKTNSRSTKRQRLAANPTTSSAGDSNAERSTDSEKQLTQQFKQQLRQMDAASIHAMSMSFMSTNSELAPLVPHDDLLWSELVLNHFGAPFPPFLRFAQPQPRYRGWDWTSNTHSCQQLRDFLRSYDEREVFDNLVQIVHGDLRTIREVGGIPIDGIVLPTSEYLTNPCSGVAGVVYDRAGQEFGQYVNQLHLRNAQPVGSVVTTPGFNTGVRTLIHCVGPSFSANDCYPLLEATYRNAMSTITSENLHCVALASISTGNQGVPAQGAAQIGLRAIQKFLRSNSWRGTIAIVCVDADVHEAFSNVKEEILQNFNVTPLYPSRVSFGTTSWSSTPSLSSFGAASARAKPSTSPPFGFGNPTSASTQRSFPFGNSTASSPFSHFGNSAMQSPAASATNSEKQIKQLLRNMSAASIHTTSSSFQTSRALAPHDASLWSELMLKHFGAPFPPLLPSMQVFVRNRGWNWTNPAHSCQQLREFLRSYDEREAFDKRVHIIRGDLSTIREVDGTLIDSIAVHPDALLSNCPDEVAAVYERAGPELSALITDLRLHTIGTAIATPGFNTGVKKIIHCLGPSIWAGNCYPLLDATYTNAMSTIMTENLHCVALFPISTGAFGIPAKYAAQVGLRAIQRYLRSNSWRGIIAVVCADDGVYDAFKMAKQEILDKFNVTPLFPGQVTSVSGFGGANPPSIGTGFSFRQSALGHPSSSSSSSATSFSFGNTALSSSTSPFSFGHPAQYSHTMPVSSRNSTSPSSTNTSRSAATTRWVRGVNSSLRPKK